MRSKTLIAGVGNPYRHDDGIGVEIIKILKGLGLKGAGPFKEGLTPLELTPSLLDVGTDGFSLLDQLSLYKLAIIIDAVYMKEEPGTVRVFSPQEALLKIKADALSTHGFGLAEVLTLAQELEVKTEIKIIGIEPLDISFGEGLSEVVEKQIPKILTAVRELLIL